MIAIGIITGCSGMALEKRTFPRVDALEVQNKGVYNKRKQTLRWHGRSGCRRCVIACLLSRSLRASFRLCAPASRRPRNMLVLIEVPGRPAFSFPIRPRGPAEPRELGFEPCGPY